MSNISQEIFIEKYYGLGLDVVDLETRIADDREDFLQGESKQSFVLSYRDCPACAGLYIKSAKWNGNGFQVKESCSHCSQGSLLEEVRI